MTGEPQAGHRHVERLAADLAQLRLHEVARSAEPEKVADGVHLVAGGDRGVGGEHDPPPHLGPGAPEVGACRHPLGDHLEAGEDRVSLVEVVDVDVEPELAERADAADAEQNLLRHAAVERRLVEPASDPGVVTGDGLEEEEWRVAPALRPPDARLDLARRDAHPHADARVLEEVGPVRREVVDRLPIGQDTLPRVAVEPAESDADHREAEVPPRLDEVAREDSETARIDRELLVEPVFHAEVRDGRGHARGRGPVNGAADRRRCASRGTRASSRDRPR